MQKILKAAKEKVGSEYWEPYSIQTAVGGYIVTGSNIGIYIRGKNKGKEYWKKENKQTVIVTYQDAGE
jgi:hypothetical protein